MAETVEMKTLTIGGTTYEIIDEEARTGIEELKKSGVSESGTDGGYYTPTVSQPDANTMRVSYAASKESMGAVATVDVTLPQGPKGDTGADGAAGKDGTSVTVSSVSESSVDGGSNVVTFSDGKALTVKNGSKGSTGATGATGPTGADGYTPVKGTDYWTAADIAEIKSYVDEAILGGAW